MFNFMLNRNNISQNISVFTVKNLTDPKHLNGIVYSDIVQNIEQNCVISVFISHPRL